MQNIPRAKRELAGLHLEPFEVPITTSKFDMAVFVAEKPDELIGYWIYSTELFEQATIQRMVRHFREPAAECGLQPDARLSALAMLSSEEVEQQEAEKKQRKQSQFKKLKSHSSRASWTLDGRKRQAAFVMKIHLATGPELEGCARYRFRLDICHDGTACYLFPRQALPRSQQVPGYPTLTSAELRWHPDGWPRAAGDSVGDKETSNWCRG